MGEKSSGFALWTEKLVAAFRERIGIYLCIDGLGVLYFSWRG